MLPPLGSAVFLGIIFYTPKSRRRKLPKGQWGDTKMSGGKRPWGKLAAPVATRWLTLLRAPKIPRGHEDNS